MTAVPTPTLPERLLGLPTTDPAVLAELATVDAQTSWDRSDDSCWWASSSAGMDVRANPDHDRIDTVFCFAEGVEEHEQYGGALPRGLEFSWSRARVLGELGAPDKSGPTHDSWNREEHRLVVRYDATGRITRVTITTA